MHETIHELTREFLQEFDEGTIETPGDDNHSAKTTINTTDSYINNRFVGSQKDKLGRRKPFKQAIVPSINVSYAGTDIDTKDINLIARRSEYEAEAFVLNIQARKWMRVNDFGTYLNQEGRGTPTYGSSFTQVIKDPSQKETLKQLRTELLDIQDVAFNQAVFDGSLFVKRLYYTPSQLRKMKGIYNEDSIDALITTWSKGNGRKETKDREGLIEVLEVYGDLPLSYLEEDGDENKYAEQFHVISFIGKEDGTHDDFELITPVKKDLNIVKRDWETAPKRTLGYGVAERLFEPQIWINYSEQQTRNQLDLASKIIFQDPDGNFSVDNVLTDTETGDVYKGSGISRINNQAFEINSNQVWSQAWGETGDRVVGTPDVSFGSTMPSGTAYRQVVALQEAANTPMRQKVEERGLFLRNLFVEHGIIEFLISTIDTDEELFEELTPSELEKVDQMIVKKAVNEYTKSELLENGRLVTPEEQQQYMNVQLQALKDGGARRSVSDLGGLNFDGIEYDLTLLITGEQMNKQAYLDTMSTALQTVAQNPGLLENERTSKLFNKLIEGTGQLSPLELQGSISSSISQATPQVPS